MKWTIWIASFLSILAIANQDSRLINGEVADMKNFPASVKAGGCTATVVGEKTIILASHCVSNGGSTSFTTQGIKYTGKCTRAKAYSNNNTADWALCLMDKKVEGVPYEHLNIDDGRVRVDDTLLLTGYGCTQSGGGGGDGKYRTGKSKVIRVPSGSSNDIITKGNAALCYGDSGGPAFSVVEKTGERFVVAINSRGNISTTSYLSSISTRVAKDFLEEWSQKNNQRLCGMHADAVGCRQATPKEEDEDYGV